MKKRIFWRVTRLGTAGLLLLLVVLAWVIGDAVVKIPGAAPLAEHSPHHAVQMPQAAADRFSIMLAHLENDEDGTHLRQVRAALRVHPGIELLIADQTIRLDTRGKLDEALRAGHARARALLQQSHADVMIWGSVLGARDNSPLILHWTVNTGAPSELERRHRPAGSRDLDLPPLLASGMSSVLGMLVSSAEIRFAGQQGHASTDQLLPFIQRVRALCSDAHLGEDRKAPLWLALADSLETYGAEKADDASLAEAIADYQQALKQHPREREPLDWAMTQNNLGNALDELGEREAGTAHLEQAVAAYRQALQELTRERAPLDWAGTQSNLGTALEDWGERVPGTAQLQQAVAAYRQALKEYTRERAPVDWAMTQDSLGAALDGWGEREMGTAQLQQAVAAYRQALQEYSRERAPLDWAMTQNNLGIALHDWGEREPGTAHLQESVAAYRQALKEYTRERAPLEWATTQGNLGAALDDLGGREAGTAHLQQAVLAYQEALKEYTRESAPLDWAGTQSNLADALEDLGERESPGTVHLAQAVAAYQEALKERTRDRVPLDWARTQTRMGLALVILGTRQSSAARLRQAIRSYTSALDFYRSQGTTPAVDILEAAISVAQADLAKLRAQTNAPPGGCASAPHDACSPSGGTGKSSASPAARHAAMSAP